jgi:hypothetical protein
MAQTKVRGKESGLTSGAEAADKPVHQSINEKGVRLTPYPSVLTRPLTPYAVHAIRFPVPESQWLSASGCCPAADAAQAALPVSAAGVDDLP